MAEDFLSITTDASKHTEALEAVGKRRLEAWAKFATVESGNKFADYVRREWLSGYALNSRTGRTRNSVQAWLSVKAAGSTVRVRPGVKVPGSLNYLAKWVGAPPSGHEFMLPAFERYYMAGRLAREVDDNIAKMLEKVTKE